MTRKTGAKERTDPGRRGMELEKLPHRLTVCKVESAADIPDGAGFFFVGKTDEEVSLVCRTEDVPRKTVAREDGWRAIRVCGVLDFSLIGILSGITGVLAEHGIGVFAVSTYNTDYILVKEKDFAAAQSALSAAGYPVRDPG